MMRILWFCNTPGKAKEHLKSTVFGGGWIDALQEKIEAEGKDELGMVFYVNNDLEPFELGRTKYFPVTRLLKDKWKRFYYKLRSRIEYDENLPRFVEIIREFKPDVITVFGTENPFGLICREVKDIPISIWIQGNLSAYNYKFFSGVNDYSVYRKLSWAERKQVKMQYKSFLGIEKIEREILRNARYIMGRTFWDRRITRLLAPDSNYFHINEVARSPFYSARWEYKERKKIVLYTTTGVNLYKGFETIVHTAVELKRANIDFEWKVAGLQENDTICKFAKLSAGVEALDSLGIDLLGLLPAEGLIQNMLQSDIFIQVSHIENSPNSLFEAMLLGMPIIASDSGGSGDLMTHNTSGILIQEGDPVHLAGTILELAGNAGMMKSFAESAYEEAHKEFSAENSYMRLMSAYNEMAGN